MEATVTNYPPIITVGQPRMIVPPCAVLSPILAAGLPQMSTVAEPFTILSGGPTQTHIEPTVAAGMFPINTGGPPGELIGPPTWGVGGKPRGAIWDTGIFVIRAAKIFVQV